MRLKISHYTTYKYSKPVFLEPHYLSFYPQQRTYYQLERFDLQVDPDPVGISTLMNQDNCLQHQCWFQDTVDSLTINVKLQVNTQNYNPFGFFRDANARTISSNDPALTKNDSISLELEEFIEANRSAVKDDPIAGITGVLNYLNANWDHSVRYEEDIHSPSECFSIRTGSCRDITWMLITILRHLDVPARFVSGYAYNPELGEGHELHAWVEFYLRGAGWLGVDPSAGIFTTDTYIPTAVSSFPKYTLPVSGTYRGDASAALETKVLISAD